MFAKSASVQTKYVLFDHYSIGQIFYTRSCLGQNQISPDIDFVDQLDESVLFEVLDDGVRDLVVLAVVGE